MGEDLSHLKYLKGKILRFEGKFAVLEFSDGQKINWPIKDLPYDLAVGQELKISILRDMEAENEKLAKKILNKILGNKNENESGD
ncbi:DUF3006 domain-containing protein [Candidatus Parcubacteria bacterium]|nr:MAG: DUF3006 domain-containing protein [Candidatus Parcubacteria bacterium]